MAGVKYKASYRNVENRMVAAWAIADTKQKAIEQAYAILDEYVLTPHPGIGALVLEVEVIAEQARAA